jgi:hypothetical protein
MSPTLADFHELYQALQQARGHERRGACQAFCQAVIGAQRRGEIGIRAAAALIEGALQVDELQSDEAVASLREQATALQSPQRSLTDDPVAAWRDLVRHIKRLSS